MASGWSLAWSPRWSPAVARGHLLHLLVQDFHVRVINAATGELPRELTTYPARDYQPIHPQHAKNTITPNPD